MPVRWNKRKLKHDAITNDKPRKYLGSFDTVEQARAAVQLHYANKKEIYGRNRD